ncbi:MAG: hypothetical protein Q9227_000123 [Pyrenula ochraceoflavens]
MAAASSEPWTVKEHIIPASFPRGYRRGLRDPFRSRLRLHVKQYISTSENARDSNGSTPLTIIFVHGAGSHKEAYEPFLSSLLTDASSPPIRQIFSFDYVNHGQSYMLNRKEIGDETDWLDLARDVLQLVNHFQQEMIAPVVGIAQSYGCVGILASSNWSPRLFQTIICIEPVIENGWYHANPGLEGNSQLVPFSQKKPAKAPGENFESKDGEVKELHQSYNSIGKKSMGPYKFRRPDTWPSLTAAREAFHRSSYFSKFHPDVFEKVIQHDIRPVDPSAPAGPVTLVTPSFLEASYYMRLDPPFDGNVEYDYASRTIDSQTNPGFYHPGPARLRLLMPGISTRICYVWSKDPSNGICTPAYRDRILKLTGSGLGGLGGKARGQVDETSVPTGGHALPLENPHGTAGVIATWLGQTWRLEWEKEEEKWREQAKFGKDTKVWAEWTRRISKL